MRYNPGWAFPLEVVALGVVLALIWSGIELWLWHHDRKKLKVSINFGVDKDYKRR